MENKIKDNRIIYLGIGVFLWLAISSFSFLFENLIKDIFLNINVGPLVIHWTQLVIQVFTYTLGFIWGIRLIKSSKKPDLKKFIITIFIFVLSQILQFLLPLLTQVFRAENYIENHSAYSNFLITDSSHYIVIMCISLLSLLIPGLIIYKNK